MVTLFWVKEMYSKIMLQVYLLTHGSMLFRALKHNLCNYRGSFQGKSKDPYLFSVDKRYIDSILSNSIAGYTWVSCLKSAVTLGYRINIQKSIVFLYTNNELSENLRNNPIYICIRKKKFLGINLTNKVKDLSSGNYKTLIKDIEDNTNNGKIYCAHGLKTKYC